MADLIPFVVVVCVEIVLGFFVIRWFWGWRHRQNVAVAIFAGLICLALAKGFTAVDFFAPAFGGL